MLLLHISGIQCQENASCKFLSNLASAQPETNVGVALKLSTLGKAFDDGLQVF